jgi:hypothetical protein
MDTHNTHYLLGLPLGDRDSAVLRRYRVCPELADLIADLVKTVTASPRLRGELA